MKGLYIVNNPDGSVRYRLSYRDPLTGKEKRLSYSMPSHSVRNQRKAEDILQSRLRAILDGSPEGALLAEAFSAYLKDMSFSWRESTALRNKATLGRVAAAFPSGAVLENITPQKWREALSDLSGTDAGKYNEYLKRVKAFLHWCVGNDYLKNDICPKIPRRVEERDAYTGEEKATDHILEPSEVAMLLDCLKGNERWLQIVRFMLLSGLRCGEALALNDADVGKDFIKVNKTLGATTLKIGPPKTPKSNRDVSITKELAVCIAEIRRYNAWIKAAYRIETPFFFFTKTGAYIRYYSFNKYLRETAEAHLGKSITTHWLRHTHASFLLAAGIPIDTISRRLGHESTEITQKVYLHVIEKLRLLDADRLTDVNILGGGTQIVSIDSAAKKTAGE